MDRSGHKYIRKTTRTTAPCRVAVVVPTARALPARGGRGVTVFEGGCAHVGFARRIGTEWTRPTFAGPLGSGELWDWVDEHTYDRTKLWVFSPVASDMLTLMRFWEYCDDGRYHVYLSPGHADAPPTRPGRKPRPWVGRLVLRGTTDIIGARRRRRGLTFVSMSNYVSQSLDRLSEWVGIPMGDAPLAGGVSPVMGADPAPTCRVLLAAAMRLISDWVAGDCGGWRETAGQLVVSLWRRHHYTQSICKHGDETAALYESEALHGGRASVWYYGDVTDASKPPDPPYDPPPPSKWGKLLSQAHRLDVVSMYPTILRDRWFPVRLTSVRNDPSIAELESWVRHFGCIACVTASVLNPEYPFRHQGRTLYPWGVARLVLAGPELTRLIAEDAILRVHTALIYDMGQPFKSLCTYLLTERQRCKAAGDSFGEVLFKSWSNRFGGKFAQRSNRWDVNPKIVPPVRWGTWRDLNASDGTKSVYRALAGVTFEEKRGTPGAGLLAAVFAYLTSYGRDDMRVLRATLPARSVLSQDTDGLWVTDDGLNSWVSAGANTGVEPGNVRLVESAQYCRWYTPKHYYSDGRWTLAGIPDGWTCLNNDEIVQATFVNPVRSAPSAAPLTLTQSVSKLRLSAIPRPDPVGPDGWTRPCRTRGGGVYVPGDCDPPAGLFDGID